MTRVTAALLAAGAAIAQQTGPAAFETRVRPALNEHCSSCHNPENPKNKIGFLRTRTAEDMETSRGMWKKVAAHLRNRTMPPVANKLSEDDRVFIAAWVDERLRSTACAAGEQAGSVTLRRLNRREYRNTIRDLLGIEFPVEDLFPADGSGGEGFDNNGETLFLPPILMERYLEAAQQILNRVVATPAFSQTFPAHLLLPDRVKDKNKPLVLAPGEQVSARTTVFADGDYEIRVSIDRPRDREKLIFVSIDGGVPAKLVYQKDSNGGPTARSTFAKLARGEHTIDAKMGDAPIDFFFVGVQQRVQEPTPDKRVLHYRLFGTEPGEQLADPRGAARRLLARFVPRAFRRPARAGEVERYLKLFERAFERGEPYEEGVKLALRGVLLSSDFLFRLEEEPKGKSARALNDYELASRLSYFLWSTMPDEELFALAKAGSLAKPEVLAEQVDRMLDDARSRSFAGTFIGQWLGTREIGGRAAPTVSAVQHFYTPDVAVDLREEPVMLFHHIVTENRPLTELLDSSYTVLTERLVKFYEFEGKVDVKGNSFQRAEWPDRTRAGILGMGSVLALTSHYQQTSPVLRGAWVLDTLLGTPAPAPPADVPPLEPDGKKEKGLTVREKLVRHQADPSCAACHKVIDPIGFAMENFDWIGRWRANDAGKPVDARGVLPTGEKFDGPVQLREVLMSRKADFLRHLTGKVMGYALGRSLEDSDHCTAQTLADRLEKDGYRARTLIRDIVLSAPFRRRGPAVEKDPAELSKPVKKTERKERI